MAKAVAIVIFIAAVMCAGCDGGVTRSVADVPNTYSEMKLVADRYATVETDRFVSGYFGRPLVSTEGAHVGRPVPIYSIDPSADASAPVLARLRTTPQSYAVPVLNSDNEILGEYLVAYRPNPDAVGWVVVDVSRRGVLVRDREAKGTLGVSEEASSTHVDHGAVWSVVTSQNAEVGVAPLVIEDHNAFEELPEQGRIYIGQALRHWFLVDPTRWGVNCLTSAST